MRDDLGMGVAEQRNGTAGALGDETWDEDDGFDHPFYEDAIDRACDLVGSLPINVLLAAGAAGLSIGVFLTNYQ
jgi:hypothetical protein